MAARRSGSARQGDLLVREDGPGLLHARCPVLRIDHGRQGVVRPSQRGVQRGRGPAQTVQECDTPRAQLPRLGLSVASGHAASGARDRRGPDAEWEPGRHTATCARGCVRRGSVS
jgi:hypothetical protein